MTNIERQTPETGRLQLALNVEDLEASTKFYSDLFGWEKTSSMEMGNGTYQMYGRDGHQRR